LLLYFIFTYCKIFINSTIIAENKPFPRKKSSFAVSNREQDLNNNIPTIICQSRHSSH